MIWVGFDFETAGEEPEYGLQPWRVKSGQAWVRSWAEVRQHHKKAIIAPESFEETQALLHATLEDWIEHGDRVCVWNGVFDIAWFCAYGLGELAMKVKWVDGMLLWKHLEMPPEYDVPGTKKKSFSLKAAVANYLPDYAGYEEGVEFDGSILELLHYNTLDAWFTLYLTRKFYDKLSAEPDRLRAAMIEAHSLPIIAQADYTGLKVSTQGLTRMNNMLLEQEKRSLEALEKHGATSTVLKSPKQLRGLMFDQWGLTPIKQGKTGPSTDQETLHELSLIDDRVALINDFREAVGNRKKFCTNIHTSIMYNSDGRTHPRGKIFGTYSGRMTYASKQGKGKDERQTGFALHQMKRDKDYRAVIRAPAGYTMVELDAASQEFRWMAILSGDETMLGLCMPGEDPHAFMGAQVVGAEYREVQQGAKAGDKELGKVRQMGKVGNLSLQYRTSAKKLLSTARVKHKMPIDLLTAEKIWRTYRRTYAGVPRYWQRQINHVKRYLFVDTLAGRRVEIPRRLLAQWEWSVESTSINYPVQGTGADQKYLALSVMRPLMRQLDVEFAFDLHDGLYFHVPDDHVDEFTTSGRYLLDNLPYEKAWGFVPPIPLTWDVKVGKTWGGMVEL